MSATRPATKTELKDYALRRLGYPTIDINVATEQLDDLIEEAIDYYQEYHYNGSYKAFLRIEVTDAIKTAAQEYANFEPNGKSKMATVHRAHMHTRSHDHT